MASPAAGELQNCISTPPTTATGAANPSPPTAPSTQAQPSQSQSQNQGLSNGQAATPIMPSHPSTSLNDTGNTKRPRDARLLHLVLANMGVHAYTERVPLQLMDFAYRYTSSILSDATSYGEPTAPSTSKKSANANKNEEQSDISLSAIRTAVAARAAYQFSSALPKEFLADIANERNRVALPRVDREYGVRLPPERYCFTGVGWGLKETWESEGEEDEEMDAGPVGEPVAGIDTVMGEAGQNEEEVDEDEFEEVMGVGNRDVDMVEG